jgi:hypothetical protein
MRRCTIGRAGLVAGLMALLLANAPTLLLAANVCEPELRSTDSLTQQYYMILAGQTDVFYDRSGPTFVMLQRTAADETDVGAFGIYAGERKQPVFGPVPASIYERFVSESRTPADVLLRLSISKPQYDRALAVMQSWERRVRENALLYPDIALDNILLVKQATEELNRCRDTIVGYELDWGLQDDISEHNVASRIPYEYFRELARLNAARHIPAENRIPHLTRE